MERLTEKDHRDFIENTNLDRCEELIAFLEDHFEHYLESTGERWPERFMESDPLWTFCYLRRWRAEMLECMANMLNARNPEKIALAKIFLQAGIVKAEDLDGALNAPGIHKVVAMYPDGVGE